MIALKTYLGLILVYAFIQNFVLAQFLGLCPFVGVSKKRDSAVGMGLAVIFVMTMASIVTLLLYKLALTPYGMDAFLDIVSFILVIASLVQFVEIVMRKVAPSLYRTLGIYLPLITTNCAILGATQLKVKEFADLDLTSALAQNTVLGIAGGLGFTLALYLMAGIRERLELAPVPESMRGAPITFIAAACMALAFFGFAGLDVLLGAGE